MPLSAGTRLGRYEILAPIGTYDVAPDGQRIVALMPAETPVGQTAQSHVIFLLNFFDALRRRVPARK